MTFMKAAAVLFLVLSIASAGIGQTPDEIRISQALYTETIPRLKLDGVRLPEALATIREIWEKAHPADPFPVGLVDYSDPRESDSDPERAEAMNPRVTFDLQHIPYV